MNNSYNKLKEIFREVSIFSDIEGILHWDMATKMPFNARENRTNQLVLISKFKHNLLSNKKIDDLINETSEESLDTNDRKNFLEMKREHLLISSLPQELVGAFSKASATCEGLWQQARKECNFKIVEKSLDELINLTIQESDILSEKLHCSKYESLIQKYEPLANLEKISDLFKDLKPFLIKSIDQIIEKQKTDTFLKINNSIDPEIQKNIAKSLMKILGFDFTRGRLDKSEHPFCGGATEDVRITTRYNNIDPFSSLEGVMHETGHAMYELGLPKEWQHQPAGRSRGMAMHESQSLLIEMQITRSKAFKKFLSNFLQKSFKLNGKEWSSNNLYTLGTRVNKTYIRVEADEVTYPLHIMLRFNLEEMLINKKLKTQDIPDFWNLEYKKLFGFDVNNDNNGCLQDIHWYAGLIGYFPTYSLGALTSAQFANTLRIQLPKLDLEIEQGNFKPLFNWLRENIHKKGSLFSTNEILQQVTNSSLNAKYFKQYIINRYLLD
mgnify:CR=1 FL=1|tara:strand:- start:358 stop:1845 length:1488 start_codon:yes stop_codon:yes gene_type:complete